MKKVLVIGKYYHPYSGGIEQVTRLYAEHISQRYDVTVLANSHKGRGALERRGRVLLHTLTTQFTLKSQPISLSLPLAFRCRDYDLIHLHAPNPYASAVLSAKMALERYKGALVITHHMDIFGRKLLRSLSMPFYRYLTDRARWISVTSAKNHAVSQDLPKDGPVVTLPLSVDPAQYQHSAADRTEAAAWRRSKFGDAPLVGFVGRHARYKGLDVLVRAVAKLEGVHAVLAGVGPFRQSCIQLAAQLGVADRVHFPGSLSAAEKSRLLLAIDVFAFPSTEITEAFGVSQLEAMLHGAAVVASNLPTGVTDVAIDELTALLAEPGNADHLACQLSRALADKSLRERLAAGATENILANFANDIVLAKFASLIDCAVLPSAMAEGHLHVA